MSLLRQHSAYLLADFETCQNLAEFHNRIRIRTSSRLQSQLTPNNRTELASLRFYAKYFRVIILFSNKLKGVFSKRNLKDYA